MKDSKGKVVSVKLSISGNVLTIKPNSKLANGKYTIFIPKLAVKDNSGNVFAKDYSVAYIVK